MEQLLLERIEKLEQEVSELKNPYSKEYQRREFATVRELIICEMSRLQKLNGSEICMEDIRGNSHCIARLVDALTAMSN